MGNSYTHREKGSFLFLLWAAANRLVQVSRSESHAEAWWTIQGKEDRGTLLLNTAPRGFHPGHETLSGGEAFAKPGCQARKHHRLDTFWKGRMFIVAILSRFFQGPQLNRYQRH